MARVAGGGFAERSRMSGRGASAARARHARAAPVQYTHYIAAGW